MNIYNRISLYKYKNLLPDLFTILRSSGIDDTLHLTLDCNAIQAYKVKNAN